MGFFLTKIIRSTFCGFFGWLALCSLLLPFNQASAIEWTFDSSPFSKSYERLLEKRADRSRMFLLWDIKSAAESYSSEIDNAFFFAFSGSGRLKYRILDRLSLDLKSVVLFQGGQAQSRFGDLLPSGPAFLSHGFLKYDILGNEMIELRAGALSQFEVFYNSVFIARRAFPGISESIQFNVDDFFFKVSAQQVVPTTYTFSTALVEREATPTLNSGNASASYETDLVKVQLKGGVFDYSNLPAMVADQSRLFGNTVQGTGFNSRFAFGYRGWVSGLDLVYNPTKDLALRFVANMLENSAAPQSFNQAQSLQASAHYRLNRDLGFDFIFTDFFVESDAVPAFFTSRNFGQTNRKGFQIEVGTQWIEKKVRLAVSYGVANLINPDPTERQLNNDIIGISLESAYDLFN